MDKPILSLWHQIRIVGSNTKAGRHVEPHQMDVAFSLPDAIFALPEEQREVRPKTHTGLCSLDDRRYFIRGVVHIPVQALGTSFGWAPGPKSPKTPFIGIPSFMIKTVQANRRRLAFWQKPRLVTLMSSNR